MRGAIIISYTEFFNSDIVELKEKFEEIRKQFKKITGYTYDNKDQRISNIYGDEFSFMITQHVGFKEKNEAEINIWNSSGYDHLFRKVVKFDDQNKIDRDSKKEIIERMDEYSKGEIHCSDCQKIMKRQDVAGRYFAGLYCTDCWERKWKAIEAKETYD